MKEEDLLIWRLSKNEPDSWFVSIGGHTLPEKQSLEEIRRISESCEDASIQVLHEMYADDDNASWTEFEKNGNKLQEEIQLIRLNVEELRKKLAKTNDHLHGILWVNVSVAISMLVILFFGFKITF